jgi:hypothetical protein
MTKRGKAAATVKFQAVMTEHAAMNAAERASGILSGRSRRIIRNGNTETA